MDYILYDRCLSIPDLRILLSFSSVRWTAQGEFLVRATPAERMVSVALPHTSHRWILLKLPRCKCCKDWSQQSTTSNRINKLTHLTRRHRRHPSPSFVTFSALSLPPSLMLWSHLMPTIG